MEYDSKSDAGPIPSDGFCSEDRQSKSATTLQTHQCHSMLDFPLLRASRSENCPVGCSERVNPVLPAFGIGVLVVLCWVISKLLCRQVYLHHILNLYTICAIA